MPVHPHHASIPIPIHRRGLRASGDSSRAESVRVPGALTRSNGPNHDGNSPPDGRFPALKRRSIVSGTVRAENSPDDPKGEPNAWGYACTKVCVSYVSLFSYAGRLTLRSFRRRGVSLDREPGACGGSLPFPPHTHVVGG